MFEHDLEKIGSAVSKHSENLKGFGFSAKNLAENPKKWRGLNPRNPSFLDVWPQLGYTRDRYTGLSRAPPLFEYSRWATATLPPNTSGAPHVFIPYMFSCRVSLNVLSFKSISPVVT